MGQNQLFLFCIVLNLLASAPAALQSAEWWVPEHVEGEGEFLCVCSGNLVTVDKISKNGRGCLIDNTLERHRYMCAYYREFEVWNYLKALTTNQSAIRVLHNAPEMPIAKGLNFYDNPQVDYVGFDFLVGPLVYKTPLNEFHFDISEIPFPDNFFHMIITSHVLEHVRDVAASISELYRVLQPGGVGFLAFPATFKNEHTIEDDGESLSEAERVRRFGQKDHVRMIGRDILSVINSVGFVWDHFRDHKPRGFYQRAGMADKLQGYRNVEYQPTYNEQVLFVHKPGLRAPPHMIFDTRTPVSPDEEIE